MRKNKNAAINKIKNEIEKSIPKDRNTRKIRVIQTIVLVVTVILIIIASIYFYPTLKQISTTEGQIEFKQKIDSLGIFGFILLFALQLAQIILILIPGEPIEVLAGMCYGVVGGTTFITASVFIITFCVTFLVRKYGKKYVYNFLDKEKINKIEKSNFYNNSATIEIILIILFMIPGTPKDLLVYLGGLLPIKYWRFLAISTFARLPSVISSTFVGANVAEGNWKTSILIYIMTFIISTIVVFVINKFDKNKITEDAINVIK